MKVSPEEVKILQAMGMALLMAQSTERLLRLVTTFVVQGEPPLTFESLTRQEGVDRRATIGQFIGRLRQRVDVSAEMGELLSTFLESRNTFVHDLSRVPGWGLSTDASRANSTAFLEDFMSRTEVLMKALVGLVESWKSQIGMDDPPLPDHEWFDDVKSTYVPMAQDWFAPRRA